MDTTEVSVLDSPRCVRWKRRAEKGEAAGRLMDECVDTLSYAHHRVQRTHGRGLSFGSTHQVLHGATQDHVMIQEPVLSFSGHHLHKQLHSAQGSLSS